MRKYGDVGKQISDRRDKEMVALDWPHSVKTRQQYKKSLGELGKESERMMYKETERHGII